VLHHALLGPMTRVSTGLSSDKLPTVHTFSDANQIPVGFHCQYPATEYRWTHRGDSRVRFNLSTTITRWFFRGRKIEVQVTVDKVNWRISPTQKVVAYANRKRVGYLTKAETTMIFRRRVRRSSLELSFRTTDPHDPLESGAHFNWHQMLVPIISIELRNTVS